MFGRRSVKKSRSNHAIPQNRFTADRASSAWNDARCYRPAICWPSSPAS